MSIKGTHHLTLDLTLVSRTLAEICEWEVSEESSVGSDHFPVVCGVILQMNKKQGEILGKWIFSYAKWEILKYVCEIEMDKIELGDTEDVRDLGKRNQSPDQIQEVTEKGFIRQFVVRQTGVVNGKQGQ